MNILAKAILFASSEHLMQVDKGGNAYILHPLRVMLSLESRDEELMAIAVLHDVMEDCDVSVDNLRVLGMTHRVIAGVEALSRKSDETYDQFIDRLSYNRDALVVKKQDLRHNLDMTRRNCVNEKDIMRINKYLRALSRVESLIEKVTP